MAATLSLRYKINISYLNVSRMRLIEIIKSQTLTTESGHPVNKYRKKYRTGIWSHVPLFQSIIAALKKKKKTWHSIVTYRSFHRFSFPQGRGGWKLAKGQGGILHRPLLCHFSCHMQEWEWCLSYPLAHFLHVSNSTSYSKILNNITTKTSESQNGIVDFFSDEHYEWWQHHNVRLQRAKHIQKETKLVSKIFVF